MLLRPLHKTKPIFVLNTVKPWLTRSALSLSSSPLLKLNFALLKTRHDIAEYQDFAHVLTNTFDATCYAMQWCISIFYEWNVYALCFLFFVQICVSFFFSYRTRFSFFLHATQWFDSLFYFYFLLKMLFFFRFFFSIVFILIFI